MSAWSFPLPVAAWGPGPALAAVRRGGLASSPVSRRVMAACGSIIDTVSFVALLEA